MRTALNIQQPSLPSLCPIQDAIDKLAYADAETRGAVFTRREVVDFILDLVGYTSDKPLYGSRLLEPSFGAGDFLLPAIERLISSWKTNKKDRSDPYPDLVDSICGVELHYESFEKTKASVRSFLTTQGIHSNVAAKLVKQWFIQGDYLLADIKGRFDFIVGNPPYIRQELISDVLISEYRSRYKTIYDRADIYVPFIERSLSSLNNKAHLGFICTDRWMKNRYGGPLRKFISKDFHLKVYVDMVDTPAFHTEVTTYPAITIFTKDTPSTTRITRRPTIEKKTLSILTKELLNAQPIINCKNVLELNNVAIGSDPWILESNKQFDLVRKIESLLPTIEEAGCKIGIGVASGADKVFIRNYDELDVEPDCKLPLAMTGDISTGVVKWQGLGIINPFACDGSLVDLKKYPRLRKYLNKNKEIIAKRHVAQKSPLNWYRTIDRIYPELSKTPKLLIPDIKGGAQIVYESGKLYPHHNLYYITSDTWDLKALQAVLMSGIARLFVSTYSTKMRGGYLRFQAQYLRRIRIPRWETIHPTIQKELIRAGECKDMVACNRTVSLLYSLSKEEQSILDIGED